MKRLLSSLPWLLLALTTSLWVFWGVSEMYYEGWGLPFPQPLAYLLPGAVCLAFTGLALWRPGWGGGLLLLSGSLFTLWWWGMAWRRGGLTWGSALAMFPVSGLLILVGALLLKAPSPEHQGKRWGGLPWQVWLTLGAPLLLAAGVSGAWLPVLLTRYDDGQRGARLIQGNGVALIWAPAGPGWNWKQPWGGYPSWDSLARYGRPPVGLKVGAALGTGHASQAEMATYGLCAYLSADGRRLLSEPQHTWRLPTVEEIVRSLPHDGHLAGCSLPPGARRAQCLQRPDKEAPLWAPDQPPIYYWAEEAFNATEAWYVSYLGRVSHQDKGWGNPRHGYRCVREP